MRRRKSPLSSMDDDELIFIEEDEDGVETTWEVNTGMNDFPPGTILG